MDHPGDRHSPHRQSQQTQIRENDQSAEESDAGQMERQNHWIDSRRIAQRRGPIRVLEPLRETEQGRHYSGPFTNPMKMPPPMTPAHSASERDAASLPAPCDAPGRTALPWIV